MKGKELMDIMGDSNLLLVSYIQR